MRDGYRTLIEVLARPLLNDRARGLHRHGQAAELNSGCVHVLEVDIGRQLCGSPTPVGCAVHIEGIRRHAFRVDANHRKCGEFFGCDAVLEVNAVAFKTLTDDLAETVVRNSPQELMLCASTGKSKSHVGVCPANHRVEAAGLVTVFDQVD